MHANCLTVLIIIATSLGSFQLRAESSGFSQIVLTFLKQKTYDYTYNKSENSLEILLKDTSPDELKPLYSYDENFVKRVFFTVKDANNTEVKVVLKDRNVRATIYDFSEPYRIVMDFYRKGYKDSHDPDTGLPLTKSEQRTNPDFQEFNPPAREDITSYQEDNESQAMPDSGTRRRLLQPRPNDFSNPNELVEILEKSASGVGMAWKSFPPYVYRVNISTYKTGTNYEDWMKKNAAKALSSGESLAQYAAQLFDFGHENKALVAYQKILHDYPMIFEKHAEHIWRLAETHLGQGNLTLADGYYTSLIEKHPEHPLANFAALRRHDINSIKYLKKPEANDLKALNAALASVRDQNLPELRAQKLIRQAFWEAEEKNKTLFEGIPAVSPQLYVDMEASLHEAENPKTTFLLSTLILNANLKSSERWTGDVADFTAAYFSKFKGNATEPYRSILMKRASDMVHQRLKNLTNEQDYDKAVATYQALPEVINTTNDSFDTMNAIAKSLRKTGNGEKAAKAYRTAADATKSPINKFRMYYWEQQSLFEELKNAGPQQKKSLQKSITSADEKLLKYWNEFADKDKAELSTELKDTSETSLNSEVLTQIHPVMLKWDWSRATAPMALDGNNANPDDKTASKTVYLISKLSERFKDLGRSQDAKDAIKLLQKIKPKNLNGDKQAENLWAKELVSLAETYRKNNQFLEAGKIYTLTGNESQSWEGRAEALYKGGLLLYRSGKRDEAIEALNQAANDGSNLLYAELAKKRLEQLKQ